MNPKPTNDLGQFYLFLMDVFPAMTKSELENTQFDYADLKNAFETGAAWGEVKSELDKFEA